MTSPTPHEDALLALAFSVRANPGAYAILVGAGVSAPSGIRTAWGVVEDLISRVAALVGDAEPVDHARWYEDRFGEPARYETLLEKLAPSPLERQRLLREYFEPVDPESESEEKKPTPAHRSIARLVKAGNIRVIVTLNFDRLLEQAIRAEGIEPHIVASVGDAVGLAPLHTLTCCIVHLHGDYLNPATMLNTTRELDSYSPQMLALLHRILADYGLIVAGWSGTYDPALISAIKTHYPSRYTLTWIEPAPQTALAAEFRMLMKGLLVPTDANTAFGLLADSVASLNSRRARHPLTVAVAAETAKRELSGRWVAIGLHDTLAAEFARLHRLPEFNLVTFNHEAPDGYLAMVERIEEATSVPVALVTALAYWGDEQTDRWWIEELGRFASPVRGSGLTKLLQLRLIAGSALFYSAGVGALASKRYTLLAKLLALQRVHPYRDEQELLAGALEADGAMDNTQPRTYGYLRPLLVQSLSLGPDPLDDAWQLFEVLRIAAAVIADPRFNDLVSQLKRQDQVLEQAQTAYNVEEKIGAPLDNVRVVRANAARERGRALGELANLAYLRKPHLLVRDLRSDQRWHSPIAERIAKELDAERETHPLVQAGIAEDATDLSMAIRAVSAAAGRIGHDLSRKGTEREVRFIPNEIWIDTGKTPYELKKSAM